MIITGVGRLGADAEVRYTANGDAVATLSLAWNYGRKDATGRRPVQWVKASLWGKRAEILAEYLLKGRQVWVVLSEVHVEQWTSQATGKEGSSLVGRVQEIDLVGGRGNGGEADHEPASHQAPIQSSLPTDKSQFDDDVPF